MADGHKWMLGAEGLALLWVNPDIRDQLKLHQFGWHMTREGGNFDAPSWHPADSAKRFECGSPNLLGAHVLDASLSLLEEIGMDQVGKQILERTNFMIERIQASPTLDLLTDPTPERRSGIVAFAHSSVSASQLHQQLMKQQVICACRGGGVRFSAHFYNDIELIEQAFVLAEQAG